MGKPMRATKCLNKLWFNNLLKKKRVLWVAALFVLISSWACCTVLYRLPVWGLQQSWPRGRTPAARPRAARTTWKKMKRSTKSWKYETGGCSCALSDHITSTSLAEECAAVSESHVSASTRPETHPAVWRCWGRPVSAHVTRRGWMWLYLGAIFYHHHH